MRDPQGAYISKVRAMFNRVEADAYEIADRFIENVLTEVVEQTPGPNLQYELTLYEATGRLRNGWRWGLSAPDTASQWEGGPYGDYAAPVVASMMAEVKAAGFQARSYAYNVVAYGMLVHEGLAGHAHIGPRPWVDLTAEHSHRHMMRAVSQVRG